MRVIKMSFIVFGILGAFGILEFLEVNHGRPCNAQNPNKTLTVLYSNNMNGEVDPCPT
jgi:hypothetical protein